MTRASSFSPARDAADRGAEIRTRARAVEIRAGRCNLEAHG